MKVLFLTKSEETSSTRIRILNLIPFLKDAGFDVVSEQVAKSKIKRFVQFARSRDYDVVVLQKKLMPVVFVKWLRFFSKKLIFDFDDAVYFKVKSWDVRNKKVKHAKRERRFNQTVCLCDGVIAANNILAERVKRLNAQMPVFIIPSAVETDGFDLKDEFKLAIPPMLAWIGTSNSQHYLNYILPALQDVYVKIPFILNVISDKPVKLSGIDVMFTPWHVKGQYEALKKCDIGIMPLAPDPFSEGKSSYKLLQYMSCQVPSVCSAVGMNVAVSRNDSYCLCADGQREFADKILDLLGGEKLRGEIGRQGRTLVVEKYSQKVVAAQLIDALKGQGFL